MQKQNPPPQQPVQPVGKRAKKSKKPDKYSLVNRLPEYTSMWEAINSGNMTKVTGFLNSGFSLLQTQLGVTPVYLAVKMNRVEILKLFLNSNQSIEMNATCHGKTALHIAIKYGHERCAQLLLEHGANPNFISTDGIDDFYDIVMATKKESSGMPSSEVMNQRGQKYPLSPLMCAAMNGNVAIVEMLLKAGAAVNVELQNWSGHTPLMVALRLGNQKTAECLLTSPDIRPSVSKHTRSKSRSPIYFAAKFNFFHIVQLLIEKRADPNEGLLVAMRRGHASIVKYLLEHGALMNATHVHPGIPPLQYVARVGADAFIDAIASRSAEVMNLPSQNPLNIAIGHGHINIALQLLKYGAEANEQTLMRAGKHQSMLTECVRNFQEGLKSLIDSPKYSDITLRVRGGREIRSHKVILYCRSPFFKQILTESPQISYFDMGDVHADLALAFLSYLYCDLYKNALASDLILIAQNYQTKRLEELCRKSMTLDKSLVPSLSSFSVDFSVLLNGSSNSLFSDMRFELDDGQSLFAHKALICSRSEYFRAMLNTDEFAFKEGSQGFLHLENVSAETFRAFLQFLYTGRVTIDHATVAELYQVAHLYSQSELLYRCSHMIATGLTEEIAAAVFALTNLYDDATLKASTLKYILDNFEKVSRTSAFQDLDNALKKDLFIAKICGSSNFDRSSLVKADSHGVTIAERACSAPGQSSLLEFLLNEKLFDANFCSRNDGEPLLHLACARADLDTVRCLLLNGARVDSLDRNRNSALHIASKRANEDMMTVLVDYGARLDEPNSIGVTPHDIIMRNEGSNFRNPNSTCAQLQEISEVRRPNLKSASSSSVSSILWSDFCDAFIECEPSGEKFPSPLKLAVHRAVIAARCPALESLYSESSRSYVIDPLFRNVIEPFIEFLYTDRIGWAEEDAQVQFEMLALAANYDMKSLAGLSDGSRFSSTMAEDIQRLWNRSESRLSDLTIISESGNRFAVHRIIVCQTCPSLLQKHSTEIRSGNLSLTYSSKTLEIFLQQLYLFPPLPISEEILDDLTAISNEYDCKSLKRRCAAAQQKRTHRKWTQKIAVVESS